MNYKVQKLLENNGENYIFPFFWQHGEDEETLRTYMRVIDEANMKAVCVESRPHPDYCGPKWWQDMDVILDEARKRDMKVWILDDSHFPTGYANGAMANQPVEKHRQSIYYREYVCEAGKAIHIPKEELDKSRGFVMSQTELNDPLMDKKKMMKVFDDDQMIGVYAFYPGAGQDDREDTWIDLSSLITGEGLCFTAPEEGWKVYVLHLTRNAGYHRNYINMLDKESCKVLIDAVYEPHYEHYKEDFGKTIVGFFSDEPELGNGHIYNPRTFMGTDNDFPWSKEVGAKLQERLGSDYPSKLVLLWENGADPDEAARIRYAYMDVVTRLVSEDFSYQIGNWCRERGVKYIGHMIEDNTQHAQTGSSLGHYYRGLAGQDMSGIDDIGGQVYPQGEDVTITEGGFRLGEFYHYMLGKLASSYAALDPKKKGDSMCEIFGFYGWCEGVRLEKYLVDHFLVRGVNHYVPHAFSPKAYPDPDCPPHFYAHGHNPQYRHFGELMKYVNRVCELISGGVHMAPVAILYHGEGDWTGKAMECFKVARKLCDTQLEYDYIPQDVFAERAEWKTNIGNGVLKINNQEYKVLCVPYMQFVTKAFAQAVQEMTEAGVKVVFVGGYPEGICDGDENTDKEALAAYMRSCMLASLEEISEVVTEMGGREIAIMPANDRLRYHHYTHTDGSSVYIFVNEGTSDFYGSIDFGRKDGCYLYNAWDNCLEKADYADGRLQICVEPLKSRIVIFDGKADSDQVTAVIREEVKACGEAIRFNDGWKRSLCRSIEYPVFGDGTQVSLPDQLAEEQPRFSGYVRYDNTFTAEEGEQIVLEITDAYEGVEVFVNDRSLGIQIVPPYRYNISQALVEGVNKIRIEVATTLERELADAVDICGNTHPPKYPTGITGTVTLWRK